MWQLLLCCHRVSFRLVLVNLAHQFAFAFGREFAEAELEIGRGILCRALHHCAVQIAQRKGLVTGGVDAQ